MDVQITSSSVGISDTTGELYYKKLQNSLPMNQSKFQNAGLGVINQEWIDKIIDLLNISENLSGIVINYALYLPSKVYVHEVYELPNSKKLHFGDAIEIIPITSFERTYPWDIYEYSSSFPIINVKYTKWITVYDPKDRKLKITPYKGVLPFQFFSTVNDYVQRDLPFIVCMRENKELIDFINKHVKYRIEGKFSVIMRCKETMISFIYETIEPKGVGIYNEIIKAINVPIGSEVRDLGYRGVENMTLHQRLKFRGGSIYAVVYFSKF